MTREFAERCFSQIEGFGEYGFPESHAASFALLVYASAWIKCHYPDVFCAAILNSQPMGFYQPAQLVRDAREHGVEVREADVNFSDWDCTLERLARRSDKASTPCGSASARSKACRKKEIDELDCGARQRLWQHRAAWGDRRQSRASRSSGWRRPMRSARSGLDRREALWIARRFGRLAIPRGEGEIITRRSSSAAAVRAALRR